MPVCALVCMCVCSWRTRVSLAVAWNACRSCPCLHTYRQHVFPTKGCFISCVRLFNRAHHFYRRIGQKNCVCIHQSKHEYASRVVAGFEIVNTAAHGTSATHRALPRLLVPSPCLRSNVVVINRQIYDNGVAGIHISGSTNFTFEATIGEDVTEGEGNVGSLDGQQPIEVKVEGSSLVTFQDMKVTSNNGELLIMKMIALAPCF